MIPIFNLKENDFIMLCGQDCWRKIVKTELAPEEDGIARTIRLWFEDGESARYCSDGEISGSTAKKYYHDIYAYKKMPRAGYIYKRGNGEILLITCDYPAVKSIDNLNFATTDCYYYITKFGKTGQIALCVLDGLELIAEYPTWQEAVNSKEFNND